MAETQKDGCRHEGGHQVDNAGNIGGPGQENIKRLHLYEDALNGVADFRPEGIEQALPRVGTYEGGCQTQTAQPGEPPTGSRGQCRLNLQPTVEPFPSDGPGQQALAGNAPRMQIAPQQ